MYTPIRVRVHIFPFDSEAAFWSRSRMPSPYVVFFFFLERVPAALQHLTKPALSFLLSPPQNAPVKARPALEQVYLLLGHSEDIFFLCRNRGHLSWQGLRRRPGTPPLQNDTSLKSPTHSGSGAVSPVEGFQLHLHACIYRHPAPGCFWWGGCKKK